MKRQWWVLLQIVIQSPIFIVAMLMVTKARAESTFFFTLALCQAWAASSPKVITPLYFLPQNGCLRQSSGPHSSTWLGIGALSLYFRPSRISVGISVKIQSREYEAYPALTQTHSVQSTFLFHSTISFVCMLYWSVPRVVHRVVSLLIQLILKKLVLILVCDPL